MKKLINTVFTLCFIIVSMQTVRHVYVRAFYDWPSVLDEYNEGGYNKTVYIDLNNNVNNTIKQSTSLDSLLVEFKKAFNAVKTIEDTASKETLSKINRYKDEPYASKDAYKRAILDWEAKEKTIHEVKVFWMIGLVLIVIGCILFKFRQQRIAIALIISGLIEMVWWSSPSFSTSGAYLEFIKLLNIKITFSFATLMLLVALLLISKKFYKN